MTASASEAIGRSRAYFALATRNKVMSMASVKLLESVLSIKPERYVIAEEHNNDDTVATPNYSELYKVIYAAVYEAFKLALSE